MAGEIDDSERLRDPVTGADWQGAYEAAATPWDLRGVTGPLLRLARAGYFGRIGLPEEPRVLIPLCGRGHDARVFAELGMRVTGIDIAPAAIAEAESLRQLNGFEASFLIRDALGLSEELRGAFDLVFDYTSFCALPVHLRRTYIRSMGDALVPEGQLLMLAFPMVPVAACRPGHPPYLVTEADLDAATAGIFERKGDFPAEDSPPERMGAERWYRFFKPGPDISSNGC